MWPCANVAQLPCAIIFKSTNASSLLIERRLRAAHSFYSIPSVQTACCLEGTSWIFATRLNRTAAVPLLAGAPCTALFNFEFRIGIQLQLHRIPQHWGMRWGIRAAALHESSAPFPLKIVRHLKSAHDDIANSCPHSPPQHCLDMLFAGADSRHFETVIIVTT